MLGYFEDFSEALFRLEIAASSSSVPFNAFLSRLEGCCALEVQGWRKWSPKQTRISDWWTLMMGCFNIHRWYHMVHMICMYIACISSIWHIIHIRCISKWGALKHLRFSSEIISKNTWGFLFLGRILASLFCKDTHEKRYDHPRTWSRRVDGPLWHYCDHTIYTIMWNTAGSLF